MEILSLGFGVRVSGGTSTFLDMRVVSRNALPIRSGDRTSGETNETIKNPIETHVRCGV